MYLGYLHNIVCRGHNKFCSVLKNHEHSIFLKVYVLKHDLFARESKLGKLFFVIINFRLGIDVRKLAKAARHIFPHHHARKIN